MEVENSLLLDVEAYVTNFISEQVPKEYAYHDVQHTLDVVAAVQEIGQSFELGENEIEMLVLTAWFHDTGYDKGATGHEERSAKYIEDYLKNYNYSPEKIKIIQACILATKMPHAPETLLQRIICDADLSHLGQNVYWDRCSRVRQEMTLTKSSIMSELEWIDFELKFINQHSYQTTIAEQLYGKRKEKHIRQLQKQRWRLSPHEVITVEEMAKRDERKRQKKKAKKKNPENGLNQDIGVKQINLGRGVETMFRTTYRTHVNLSSIADNKANIMLSINAIVISILVSTLLPQVINNSKLIIPTIVLLTVCLLSIIFATLSTRPKITEGKSTIEDIKQKRSNLLFFGNFYNMELDEFHWGMTEMIKDPDFVYSSMTRDLYFLGIVLAKKYRYLRICYGIFMYGLVVAVIAFAVALLL
jgi:predicted metal-dependent HD superfamily phosphohydrolase/protein-S-isoprenylcysteine O-methyltransferase Ste14